MKLYRTATFYNPFSIDVNGKSYELADIVFFDKDGVICRTNRGWFMSGITTNNDFNILEIPGDVKKKIKVDFNEKQAFVVRAEGRCGLADHALYIPSSSGDYQLRRLCAPQWQTIIGRLRGRRTSTGCQ